MLEVLIVVVGVVVGFQITAWGEGRSDAAREQTYLRQLVVDLTETERIVTEEDSVRFARTLPSVARLVRSFGHEPKPPRDSILTWFPDAWRMGIVRPVLGTTNALVSSGDINLIRSDSLRSAIIAYVDMNERFLERQRVQHDIAEEAGQRISRRVDLSEWVLMSLPDSAREAEAALPTYNGLTPTGDWSSPIPLDADAFFADPTMYTSAWALSLELGHIAGTHRRIRESAADLRQRIEAELNR